MSYFEAKMHQISISTGAPSRPRWGSSRRSPDPLAGFKGSYVWRKGRERNGKGERGRGEKGRGGG